MLTRTQCEYYQAGDQYYVGQWIGCGHGLREYRLCSLLDDRPENEVPAEGDGTRHDHQAIECDARAGCVVKAPPKLSAVILWVMSRTGRWAPCAGPMKIFLLFAATG